MRDFPVERDRLNRPMCGVKDRHPRSLIHSSRLHADESVLEQVDPSDSMLAADLVQFVQKGRGGQAVPINRYRYPCLEVDLDIARLVGRALRRAGQYEYVLRWLGPRVLEYSALIADVHQIAVHRIGLVLGRGNRNAMLVAIANQVGARLEAPLAPGRNHLDARL